MRNTTNNAIFSKFQRQYQVQNMNLKGESLKSCINLRTKQAQ